MPALFITVLLLVKVHNARSNVVQYCCTETEISFSFLMTLMPCMLAAGAIMSGVWKYVDLRTNAKNAYLWKS